MVRFLSDLDKAWDSRDYFLHYLARLWALGFLVIMYTSVIAFYSEDALEKEMAAHSSVLA